MSDILKSEFSFIEVIEVYTLHIISCSLSCSSITKRVYSAYSQRETITGMYRLANQH